MLCLVLLFSAFYLFHKTLGTLITTDTLLDSYDYVICGGGLSGLVVASRLTEDTSVNVLVISDGSLDDGAEDVTIPRFNAYDRYARVVTTDPQDSLNGDARPYAVGQVVGGGTIFNGMLFVRGTSPDYDAWELLGNEGWNWESMLRYMIKSETYTPEGNASIQREYGISYTSSVHGKTGPMYNGFGDYFWPQSANLFQGAAIAGVPTVGDCNDGTTAGAKFTPSNINPTTYERCTARNAYWDGNSGRSNFHLLTNQTVTRIVFQNGTNLSRTSSSNYTANQVEFGNSGSATRTLVNVTQEVIISGGSIFSPQILEHSGIGPRSILQQFGIEVLVDLPGVGQNYMDHPMIDLKYTYENVTDSPAMQAANATREAENRRLYTASRTGPWTSWASTANLYPSLPSISNRSEAILGRADAQSAADYLPGGADATVVAGYKQSIALNRKLLANKNVHMFQIINDNSGGWTISLMHPFSRGYVHISSADPFSDPTLNPRYSSNPLDNDLFVEGMLWNRVLLDTEPMQELQPNETQPSRDASEADLRDLIKRGVRTEWHGSGTCAMLPKNLGGVVNPDLQVYGTDNVRVIDASIMPIIIGANSQASLYGVAEKGADIIKAAANSRKKKRAEKNKRSQMKKRSGGAR